MNYISIIQYLLFCSFSEEKNPIYVGRILINLNVFIYFRFISIYELVKGMFHKSIFFSNNSCWAGGQKAKHYWLQSLKKKYKIWEIRYSLFLDFTSSLTSELFGIDWIFYWLWMKIFGIPLWECSFWYQCECFDFLCFSQFVKALSVF